MKIQFIGATHEVTGSCTLLEVCGKKYLVDCGMEQGIDVFENVPIPIPANTIEAVFLTHAHICGVENSGNAVCYPADQAGRYGQRSRWIPGVCGQSPGRGSHKHLPAVRSKLFR